MRVRASASIVAAVVVLATSSAYLAFGVVGVSFDRTVSATLILPHASGLVERSPILVHGLKVGEVTSLHHNGAGIDVDFSVSARHRIPLGSPVRVESLSALGEAYVEFAPETDAPPFLDDGRVVDARDTVSAVTITELASGMTSLLDRIDSGSLASVVRTLHDGVEGTEDVVPDIADSTVLLAATMSSRTDEMRGILTSLQDNVEDMSWAGPAMTEAAGPWSEFGPAIAAIAQRMGDDLKSGRWPTAFEEGMGLVPFLDRLSVELARLAPELEELRPILVPIVDTATWAVGEVDVAVVISQALATTSPDPGLRIRLTPR